MMTLHDWFLQKCPQLKLIQAQAVLELSEEGATVPFMARYRKERTQGLDEVDIQKVLDVKEEWDTLVKRKDFILQEIEKQGKLTDELKNKILSCFSSDLLEDLYLPYKQKRVTKAQKARQAGLGDPADALWNFLTAAPGAAQEPHWSENDLTQWIKKEAGFETTASVLQGIQDILVEKVGDQVELKNSLRTRYWKDGKLSSQKGDKATPNSKYDHYFVYTEKLSLLNEAKNSHRYLALRRGWMEEELKLQFDMPFDEIFQFYFDSLVKKQPKVQQNLDLITKAVRLGLKGSIQPSLESEIHQKLKETADAAASDVFADNVRNVLMGAPLGAKAVLGVDPGQRTGCKLAIVNENGKYLHSEVIYLLSEDQKKQSKMAIQRITTVFTELKAIAIGNGTASRETEAWFRSTLADLDKGSIPIAVVSESGASIYSASEIAREEFPDLDATVRGAISIARRLQDPLAELIKVDPKSIGVGQYQHDISPRLLQKKLQFIVESCVNTVGVNVNTASAPLLSFVSGIGPGLAKALVQHREQEGLFQSREDLLKVGRFGKKNFEQAAGFLRVPQSQNPLDNTSVHPERYPLLQEYVQKHQLQLHDLVGKGAQRLKSDLDLKKQIGEYTWKDVIQELEKPGRDPRAEFEHFEFRKDIHELKDVTAGMICTGLVTNVTNFGAFVDIGVHQDGLVHISQLSDRFVEDPRSVVQPGDKVKVKVLAVNLEKRQMSLSLNLAAQPEGQAYAPGQKPGPASPGVRREHHNQQRSGGFSSSGSGGGKTNKPQTALAAQLQKFLQK